MSNGDRQNSEKDEDTEVNREDANDNSGSQGSGSGMRRRRGGQTHTVSWREKEEARSAGVRVSFTHTILFVSVLAIAAMVGGGIILYLRAVYALELGVEELSQKETEEIANKLQLSFSVPIRSGTALKNYYYYTSDSGVVNASTYHAMTESVKYHGLSSIQGSSVIQEAGVVLLPKHKDDQYTDASLDSENMYYSHVWYDILRDNTTEYTHARYAPGHQPFDTTDTSSEFYLRPVTERDIIHPISGVVSGTLEKPFSPDSYVNNTLDAEKFPYVGGADTELIITKTVNTHIDLSIDTEIGIDQDVQDEYVNHEWRTPQIWVSSDNFTYAFCAWDAIYEPPKDPAHPFAGFGAVQISMFFVFHAWDGIVAEHRDDDTIVVVYDRHHGYVYSPSYQDPENATDTPCQIAVRSLQESHNDSRMAVCSSQLSDSQTYKDIKSNDEGYDRFALVDLDGEEYYVSYKHIYRSYTTNIKNGTTSTTLDIAVMWGRKSSIVRAEITKVITILIIFVVGVFLLFVVLFAAQLIIIGKPMKALVAATEAMAQLDVEGAKKALNKSPCDCSVVKVKEVEALTRSFRRTLRFMAEYKAFMPQGLDCDTEETEYDDSAAGNTEHSPYVMAAKGKPARVPSEPTDMKDAKTLERLQAVGLKRKIGSVLEARMDKATNLREDDIQKSMHFVAVVLASVKRYGGIMLRTSPFECVATWNTHNSCNRHAQHACFCAMELKRRAFSHNLKISSVVATGPLMAGAVGDNNTRAIAASGVPLDIVQGASHLCSYLGVSVLISEETFDRVRASLDARAVDKVVIDSREDQVSKMMLMYELKGEKSTVPQITAPDTNGQEEKQVYNEGWRLFTQGYFSEARGVLEKLEKEDRQVSRVLNLARLFEQQGAPGRGDPYVRKSRMPWEDFELQLPNNEGWCGGIPEPTQISELTASTADDANDLCAMLKAQEEELEQEEFRSPLLALPISNSMQDISQAHFSAADTNHSSIGARTAPTEGAHSALITTACSEAYSGGYPDQLPPKITTTKNKDVYSSGKVLGEGSYGKVYVGMTPDGELIALKVLNISHDKETVKELANEVSMLSKVRHEHIVVYHGLAVLDQLIVICMEYMPGGSLAQLLQHFGCFNESTVKRYTKDMLKGLEFLHQQEIMHRDLKPGNVLVCSDGTCKLADFGTCASLAGGAIDSDTTSAPMVGTPLYMSPEVIQGERNVKSDVWSFGITMAELLLGVVPYDVALDTFLPVTFVYQVGLCELRPTIPDSIDAPARSVLEACLKEEPDDRMSCSELLSEAYFTN